MEKSTPKHFIIKQAYKKQHTNKDMIVSTLRWVFGIIFVVALIGAMTYKHLHKPNYQHPLHHKIH